MLSEDMKMRLVDMKASMTAAKKELTAFSGKFAEDSHEAFHWCRSAVAASATVHVYRIVFKLVENDISMQDLLDVVDRNIADIASIGSAGSSAPLDAALGMERLRAWSEVREHIYSCERMERMRQGR